MGHNLDPKERKNIFKEWLEQLQQESWQLELLISGFALYGIWAGRDVVHLIDDYITLHQPDFIIKNAPDLIVALLKFSWQIFFINLLTHVIFRGLWIGTIGLRYVSGEIDYESLRYSNILTEYLKKKVGSFDDFIERLERFCSVLFAYTFLLFFIFLSLVVFTFWLNVLLVVLIQFFGLENNDQTTGWVILLYMAFAIMVFIDFVSFGAFKRIKEPAVARVYKYFYIASSFLTFSFLYRPLLYNFIDDRYTRKLLWWSIPYFFLIIFVLPGIETHQPYFPDHEESYFSTSSIIDAQMVQWWFYGDLRDERRKSLGSTKLNEHRIIKNIWLEEYETAKDHLKVFLRQTGHDRRHIEATGELTPYNADGIQHSALGIVNEDDSTLVSIKEKQISSASSWRSNQQDLRKNDREAYLAGLDSIEDVYQTRRKDYYKKKLKKLKDLSLEMYRFKINEVEVPIEDIEWKLHIHPNAGEKGYLLYLPLDSLDPGFHQLMFTKRRLDKRKDWYNNSWILPFVKN